MSVNRLKLLKQYQHLFTSNESSVIGKSCCGSPASLLHCIILYCVVLYCIVVGVYYGKAK